MRPYQAFHVLEMLRNSSSAPLRRKGVVLSADDTATVLDVYQQWLLLCMDLGYLLPDTLERQGHRLWVDLTRVDVLDLNNAMAECLQSIRLQTRKGFKALCQRISSHLYSLVRDDFERILVGDVYAAKRLVQLFSYTSRLSLKDIDLTQQMLDGYLEVEASIVSDFETHLISSLNSIVKRWIGIFCPNDIYPQHGPGGVAGHGRCSLEVKYKDLTSDARLEYAFGPPTWIVGPYRSSLDRISQTIFVAKSYKTFRTISMEPSTLQYFQQGVWKVIDHLVMRNPYLRNRIGFHDQDRNKRLAQRGSIERNYATIDLSSASDSVGYQLVKKLFKGTWMSRFIVALRSTKTILPDGRIIELKKFSPMGSALCFPIETIVFASICEKVTREHHVNGDYSVYGDDIIVPTQCVDAVMQTLESLGFRVNREKSYYQNTCWFRESCGGEYCDGFDVSPMRISRSYASRERYVRFAKLIELANNAYRKGYSFLRGFFISKIRALHGVVLFSPTELLSDNYTNYHTKRRWNRNLQRIDVKVNTLCTKYPRVDLDMQDELIRYRHWFESTAERSSLGDGFESVVCKPMVLLQDAWRAKPYDFLDQEFIDLHTSHDKSPS